MSHDGWSGRKVTRLKAFVVERDGGICHRCGQPGADSSDHYPTSKVDLEYAEWWNPDNLRACHLSCNVKAGAKLGNQRRREKESRATSYAAPSREW
jgi:5-methylcytosine-specific restriction endonuclease McrA